MNRRIRVLLILAAFLSCAAAVLWHWQGQRKDTARNSHDRWMAYLQGPLSDLLYGSSRLRPLLGQKSLSVAERATAKEAVEHLERSASAAQAATAIFAQDPLLSSVAGVGALHLTLYSVMQAAVTRIGQPMAKEAVQGDAQVRAQLWALLASQRLTAETFLNKEEILEMNALLYSLQEETGLPQQ